MTNEARQVRGAGVRERELAGGGLRRAGAGRGGPWVYCGSLLALAVALAWGAAGCGSVDGRLEQLREGKHTNRIDAVADLLEALDDEDAEVLARRDEIARALTVALDDPSPLVRQVAVDGLARFEGKPAAGRIADRLRDQDPWVRGRAASALGQLGALEARGAIEDLLAKDPSPHVRQRAAGALAAIGAAASLRPLYVGLADAAPAVRFACLQGLRQMTGLTLDEDPRTWRPEIEKRAGS